MRLRARLTGLWRDPNFLKFWAGRTVSQFGSLLGALQFTAVVALQASPFQMGILAASGTAPGLILAFVGGVWVDRLRRRPILVAADLGRALTLASVPLAFFAGALRLEHLYAVAFLNGALGTLFDIAAGAYVPSLVSRDRLTEANSKLTASESVVETSAFSVGGWIVQLFSAMFAVAIDALSFLASAILLWRISKPEPSPIGEARRRSLAREILAGLRVVWTTPALRAIAGSTMAEGLAFGIVGAVVLVYGVRELGFNTGALGSLFAVGGISSFAGASLAARVTRRFGIGPAMIGGILLFSLSILLLPAARGPLLVAGAFLAVQQLGDGLWTIYSVNEVSLRQAVTRDRLLGRVNGSLRFAGVAMILLGSLLGGALAEVIGMRLTLVAGSISGLLGALWLALSPIRAIKDLPEPPGD